MNSHWHHMMESLFNSKSWQQLDTEQLKRMTLEYPYFPIAQFMYARKLKLDHHSAYPEQAAKTALYFTNPYWLNWQMNLDRFVEDPIFAKEKTEVASAEFSSESDVAVEHIDHESPIIDEEIHESYIDEFERAHPQDESVEIPKTDLEAEETVENDEVPEATTLPSDPIVTFMQEEAADNPITLEEPIVEPVVVTVKETPATETISNPDEPLIPIEPLFTTDYFASQGIKLSEAEETSDRLGQKLKSFTEWLKTMKRVQPKEAEKVKNDIYDQRIQRIAETSNESREVLTETMAEVLLLQGLKEKAIEVYQKLSLLNPQKSAYFAAKIEEIKVV